MTTRILLIFEKWIQKITRLETILMKCSMIRGNVDGITQNFLII